MGGNSQNCLAFVPLHVQDRPNCLIARYCPAFTPKCFVLVSDWKGGAQLQLVVSEGDVLTILTYLVIMTSYCGLLGLATTTGTNKHYGFCVKFHI